MKLIAAIFFLPILCLAQYPSYPDFETRAVTKDLEQFSAVQGSVPVKSEKVVRFVEALAKKKSHFSNDTEFLEQLFQQTHRRFLKHYQANTTFNELLQNGTYNCLTATSLYTILLDQFGIDFSIVETNYHIFILAKVDGGNVLLETTDQFNGFITDGDEIANRINRYKMGNVEATSSSSKKVYYQYQQVVFNTISKDQLRGLVHYNLSVDAYNEKNLAYSTEHFVSAFTLYPSSRLEEFSQILQLTIVRSNLDQQTQKKLLSKIQTGKRFSQSQVMSMVTH